MSIMNFGIPEKIPIKSILIIEVKSIGLRDMISTLREENP